MRTGGHMLAQLIGEAEPRRGSKRWLLWRAWRLTRDVFAGRITAWRPEVGVEETREFRRAFRGILRTPPLRCNPQARTEIHSLVCHKHLTMYSLMIKSFLRFVDDVAVVVHDDGSLTWQDVRTLERQVKGLRTIPGSEEEREVDRALRDKPLSRAYRSRMGNGKALFDFSLFARSERLIAFDSDVLFLRRPDELVDWVAGDRKEILYLNEAGAYRQEDMFSTLGYPEPLGLCIAILCFPRSMVDFQRVEEIIAQTGEPNWHTGQNTYALLARMNADTQALRPLDPESYQSPLDHSSTGLRFGPGAAVFRHYWTSYGLDPQHQRDAEEVLMALGA